MALSTRWRNRSAVASLSARIRRGDRPRTTSCSFSPSSITYDVAADLDLATWDSYPLGALEEQWFDPSIKAAWLRTGHPDLRRSITTCIAACRSSRSG